MPLRPYILLETNYRQIQQDRPNIAVLPWGATEAHGYHLPYGTDFYEGTAIAHRAAQLAHERGARPIVLPTIPFGNDEQQLDQVATISITTRTAAAILRDVVRSLKKQGIDRLLLLNAHGGNEFKPMVRDLVGEFGSLIVVVNFWQMAPEKPSEIFLAPGDHADEGETSLMLHLHPELVVMDQAGDGRKVPFEIEALRAPGVWTPRPWSRSHPDTGSGDPRKGTAEKGRQYFEAVAADLSKIIEGMSKATKGQSPYL
jgi:creatinine amidohydrolase